MMWSLRSWRIILRIHQWLQDHSYVDPVEFPQMNTDLKPPESRDDVGVLPSALSGDLSGETWLVSCWHVPFWNRVMLLIFGHIWLQIETWQGQTHPPLTVRTFTPRAGTYPGSKA